MRLRFFIVPCIGGEQMEAELNRFLASKKVLTVDRQVVVCNGTPCWACCVCYLPTSEGSSSEPKENKKVDYKAALSPEAFEKFSLLRAVRKQLAVNDAVPAYMIFTDAELAEMTNLNAIDVVSIQTIKGIGGKRVERYGEIFCDAYSRLTMGEIKE